jgi:hypothetical protein
MEKKALVSKDVVVPIAIVAVLNFLLWLGYSGFGIGLSVDSANYFSVAQSISEGEGFMQFDYFPYLNAPPLYPLLLSLSYFLGVNSLNFALALQGIFFNLGLYFFFNILRFWLRDWPLFLVFGLGAGCYFNFAHVYMFALSEAGAVCFLLAYLHFILRDRQGDWRYAASFLGLLVMQRYIAWFLLPGIALFWYLEKRPFKYFLWHLLPSIALTGLWFYRNSLVGSNPLGEHELASKLNLLAFSHNLKAILLGIASGNKLFAAVSLFLVCLAFGFWNQKILHGKLRATNLLILLMAIGFLLLLLLEENLQMVQLPRYLSILWMPMLLLVGLFLLNWEGLGKHGKWILLILILVQTLGVLKFEYHCRIAGSGGFNSPKWQAYKGLVELQELQEGDLVSNFPDMVWWLTGKKCRYSPYVGELKSDYEKRGVLKGKVLIWFNDTNRNAVMNANFGQLSTNFSPIDSSHGVEIGYIK